MAPIHWAARLGHLMDVKRLAAEDPALVNASNGHGAAPLNLAAHNGHLAVVKCLLDHGARIDQISLNNYFHTTPLHCASSGGHVEVVKLLMERGADPSITDENGCTPLHSACLRSHLAMVSRGGDHIDQSNRDGCTPLCFAAWHGHTEVVRVLLQVGADPCIPLGCTEVRLRGSLECIALLQVSDPLHLLTSSQGMTAEARGGGVALSPVTAFL